VLANASSRKACCGRDSKQLDETRRSELPHGRRRRARLGDLVDQVVFLGGATTNLLLTDPAAPSVRPTLDVDVVVQVASAIEYLRLERELEQRGFLQDESPDAPRCRRIREGVRLDVMPTDAAVLGFTNRWYPAVCATATRVELEPDLAIRLVTPPLFVATKLEAFRGRGEADLFGSRDLEDVIAVIDGRMELPDEVANAPAELRFHLAESLREFLAMPRFRDAVQGHLPGDATSAARARTVLDRIVAICRLAERA
jgi:hypothetical protein